MHLELYTFTVEKINDKWDENEKFYHYNEIKESLYENLNEEFLKYLENEGEDVEFWKKISDDLKQGRNIVNVISYALAINYEHCSNVLEYQIEFENIGDYYIVSHAVICQD